MIERVRTRWSRRRETVFLRVLGETCNVTRACKAAGLNANSVYVYKRRHPAFAAAWADALAQGYATLEAAVLSHALAGLGVQQGDDAGADDTALAGLGLADALSPAAVQVALLVLNRHRATVEGKGKPMTSHGVRATAAETDAALTRKLDALAKRLKLERARR